MLLTVVVEDVTLVVLVVTLLDVVDVTSVLEILCTDVVEVGLLEVTEDAGRDPEGEP